MTYKETIHFLYEALPMFHRIGEAAIKKDLTNIRWLCQQSGYPQHDFPSIHIAGTNGKGSTSHMLASVFQAAGWKVGLYTSPHYVDFRERIRVNGKMISQQQVIRYVEKYKSEWPAIAPSFFEITVAMAFDYFSMQKVDIAIIETGLGGRLDSTNVILPMLSVITNIGFDHINLLGHTLPEIASEKAGIIKPGIPVIIGEWRKETAPVFNNKAKEESSPIHFASKHLRVDVNGNATDRPSMDIRVGTTLWMQRLHTDMSGPYQKQNITTVLETLWCWNHYYPTLKISPKQIRQGLSKVREHTGLMGRWMVVQKQPLVMTDAAHNEHGMKAMLPGLLAIPARQRHFVLGFVNDKDISKVLRLFPTDGRYYWCAPDIPRKRPADEVKAEGSKAGLIGDAFSSVLLAYKQALKEAGRKDLVFVGGSSYVVGEFLAKIKKPASGRKQA